MLKEFKEIFVGIISVIAEECTRILFKKREKKSEDIPESKIDNARDNIKSPVMNIQVTGDVNAPLVQYGDHEKTILERRDEFMQQMTRTYMRLWQDGPVPTSSPMTQVEKKTPPTPQRPQNKVVYHPEDFTPENLRKINGGKKRREMPPYIEPVGGYYEEMFPERKGKRSPLK